ncbi:hypothetical protein [Autumnicola edwardsiae]|uniref:Lipoprotein n=1 Tax=Autumnicola edwardsiae TaxID=3075594 RepID=A0ABU3D069_9FLAO|nr:hypothetical protein [Zunongwangia sp. F297]MDT0651550.1 hypothetical protein [Zunongwangia sp. F297]
MMTLKSLFFLTNFAIFAKRLTKFIIIALSNLLSLTKFFKSIKFKPMKKLFTFLFVGSMIASCSNDEVNEINEPEAAVDLETQVSEGLYDNSNLGIYEGVFTSLESNNRATVRIEVDGKGNPVASFVFPNGGLKAFRADQKLSKSSSEKIHFSDEEFDFDFAVNEDGTEPVISNVTYMGEKGDVMIVKETSKAAVTPRTGTYACLPGSCDTHPDLGVGKTQTFNAILQTSTTSGNVADDSRADVVFQVVLGSTTYYMNSSTPSMEQTSCTERQRTIGGVVFAVTRCQFSGAIQGGSGLATVNGTHRYGRQVSFSGTTGDFTCSDYFGTIVYESSILGTSSMEFVSDDIEGEDDYCFPTEGL